MENENNWLQLAGQAGPRQTKIPFHLQAAVHEHDKHEHDEH